MELKKVAWEWKEGAIESKWELVGGNKRVMAESKQGVVGNK